MLTTCVKCGSHMFELCEIDPSGSNIKFNTVQCIHCGVAIGVVGYFDPSLMINQLEKKIDKLGNSLRQIEYDVETIQRKVSS